MARLDLSPHLTRGHSDVLEHHHAQGTSKLGKWRPVRRHLRRVRVPGLFPAASQQRRRQRQSDPSRRLRKVPRTHRQAWSRRTCTLSGVSVLRAQGKLTS